MGTRMTFQCSKCDYNACVSGGPDCGFYASTDTMVCNTCKEVVDVVTSQHIMMEDDDDSDLNVCPECEGKDLKKWEKSHPCPKCGGKMAESDDGLTVLWD